MKFSLIKRNWIFLLTVLLCCVVVSCVNTEQEQVNYREGLTNFNANEYPNENITDGPYIFYENDETILKWIEANHVISKKLTDKNFHEIKDNFGFELKPEWISQKNEPIDYKQEFKDVDRILAISDIHGQYKLFVKLLREYNVIDEENNWIFEDGHLMIVGDIFDRGPQVNEALWLVFKLSHQALESGGRLHYLMGNHEEMVINKDHRYVNEKYLKTAEKLNLSYEQLYAKNTLIGNWLYIKPIMIQINDILFVHAGISPKVVEKGYSAEEINRIFAEEIIGKTKQETEQDSVLSFLRGSDGPIWYRGYFRDANLDQVQVNEILKHFNMNHIVVGHTSQKSIVSLFQNRIFGVDSSIKNGKYGEVLIYDKGDFFRGTIKMTPDF